MTYICHCTHVDGKVYPDPNRECPNGHTRGHGKTAAAKRTQWWDDQLYAAKQFQARLNIIAAKGLAVAANPAHVPAAGPARWACTSPTGHPPLEKMQELYADYTRGMTDGLAGRSYTQTRQEAWLRNMFTDAASKVRAQ